MKNLILAFSILLSLTSFSQCEYRYFGPSEYETIIKEDWSNSNSILYRKYYSTKKDTVELRYVGGCSFSQKNKTIDYQDETVQFFQSYIKSEDCSYLVGDNDYEMYTRSYYLPTERYDPEIDGVVFTKVSKVVVFSHYKDFRHLSAITFYEEDLVAHHYIF